MLEAAFNGSREIGFTIVSMTLSLVAVFIPVLFMGGIVGRLLHEFAVTIGVAILVSGFVSLTLTPMLCSRFLRPPATRNTAVCMRHRSVSSTGCFMSTNGALGVFRHRLATLMIAALLLLATALSLHASCPKGFLPSEDTGQIFGFTEAPRGSPLKRWCGSRRPWPLSFSRTRIRFLHVECRSRSGRGREYRTIFMRLKPAVRAPAERG